MITEPETPKVDAPPPGCSKMLYTTPTGSCCSLSIRVDAPDDVMDLARRLCKLLPDDVTAFAATFAANRLEPLYAPFERLDDHPDPSENDQ